MITERFSLEGKVAIITGGGTGLGKQMALAMARAGADIVVAARRPGPLEETKAEVEALGRRALAIPTDASKSEQVDPMVDRVVAEFGHVDIMVNNAGGGTAGASAPITQLTDEGWFAGIAANLTTTFMCSRSVCRYMIPQKSGKIINIASGWGLRGGRQNLNYCTAKGGVVNFTRALAMQLAHEGIQVTCIAPGAFPTRPMPEATTPEEQAQRQARLNFYPLRRQGNPKDIGLLAVFLASPASDYMTGETVLMDGGALAGGYAPFSYHHEVPLAIGR